MMDGAVYEAKVQRWEQALAAIYSALQHGDSVVWADLGRQLRPLMLDAEVSCIAISLLRAMPEDEALRVARLALGDSPGESNFQVEAYKGEAEGWVRYWVDGMSTLYRRLMMKSLWTAMPERDRARFRKWIGDPPEARNG